MFTGKQKTVLLLSLVVSVGSLAVIFVTALRREQPSPEPCFENAYFIRRGMSIKRVNELMGSDGVMLSTLEDPYTLYRWNEWKREVLVEGDGPFRNQTVVSCSVWIEQPDGKTKIDHVCGDSFWERFFRRGW
jgi:hypothetical protein